MGISSKNIKQIFVTSFGRDKTIVRVYLVIIGVFKKSILSCTYAAILNLQKLAFLIKIEKKEIWDGNIFRKKEA